MPLKWGCLTQHEKRAQGVFKISNKKLYKKIWRNMRTQPFRNNQPLSNPSQIQLTLRRSTGHTSNGHSFENKFSKDQKICFVITAMFISNVLAAALIIYSLPTKSFPCKEIYPNHPTLSSKTCYDLQNPADAFLILPSFLLISGFALFLINKICNS